MKANLRVWVSKVQGESEGDHTDRNKIGGKSRMRMVHYMEEALVDGP